MRLLGWVIAACLLVGVTARADETRPDFVLRNLRGIREKLSLTKYDTVPGLRDNLKNIKIAILDNGYGDLATIEKDLPKESFEVVKSYSKELIEEFKLGEFENQKALDNKIDHGRTMALLSWSATGYSRTTLPKYYLLNANGLTNFARAIRWCIQNNVNIILYSQAWEHGGNFDGRGFINSHVTEATKRGILFVTAAGNYRGRVFNAPVEIGKNDWLKLNDKDGLRIFSRSDRNPVRIVLAWNRFNDDESKGTDADLALFLYDEKGELKFTQDLKQVVSDRKEGESLAAREEMEVKLNENSPKGFYTIKVQRKGGHFTRNDRLRIIVVPLKQAYYDSTARAMVNPVEFPDATKGQEILIPADHPDAITIGDMSSTCSLGPTMANPAVEKPDIQFPFSAAEFSDNEGSTGTSNAAAFFSGVVAMMKANVKGDLVRRDVVKNIERLKASSLVKAGEGKGIDDMGVDVVRKVHPLPFEAVENILNSLKKAEKGPILLAGRYKNNGPYIMAIDRSPLELRAQFRSLPALTNNPEHYEIFVAVAKTKDRRDATYAYFRDRLRPDDARPQPWEEVLRTNPELFVQVVQARPRRLDPDEPEIPYWRTPAP